MKPILHLAAVGLLLGATGSAAHETWITPEKFILTVGSEVRVQLGSGMTFPSFEAPIRPQRIAQAWRRLGVDLHPRPIELEDEQVSEYFEEIAAPPAVREAWEKRPAGDTWREINTKHAKTFVRAGSGSRDRAWAEPLGMVLEIVPECDLFDLRAGDAVGFRLLQNGVPVPGWPLGLMIEGASERVFRTTDECGHTDFSTLVLQVQREGGDRPGLGTLTPGMEVRFQIEADQIWHQSYSVGAADGTLLFEPEESAVSIGALFGLIVGYSPPGDWQAIELHPPRALLLHLLPPAGLAVGWRFHARGS